MLTEDLATALCLIAGIGTAVLLARACAEAVLALLPSTRRDDEPRTDP